MINCQECRFWAYMPNEAVKDQKNYIGQCRLNPPVVLFVPNQTNQGYQYPETHFPITSAPEWCGKAEQAR